MAALEYQFGTGNLVAVRNDITNPTPAYLGVLQDMQFDFDFTNKSLTGQYQLPVDVARGALKMTGKFKFGRVFSGVYDLLFGQGVTGSSGNQIYVNEAHTPVSTTQQVTNHSGGITDLGVFYASSGTQLNRVAGGSESTGNYSVNTTTGTYTFAVADEVALLFNYVNAVTNLNELVLANQLMGSGPTFGLYYRGLYKGNYANFVFNNCTTAKMSNPFKNQDYMITELDVDIFADSSNNIGNLSFSQ